MLPIFILSIADFLLACSWIVGGTMWFAEIANRTWCFFPSLLSVVSDTIMHGVQLFCNDLATSPAAQGVPPYMYTHYAFDLVYL